MVLNAESEIGLAARESHPRKHGDSLPRRRITPGLNAAIKILRPSPITRQQLLDLFDNRASFACARAWRYGWGAAPEWATDLIRSKLRAKAAELEKIAAAIVERKSETERRRAHWHRWRARQAEEREKKRAAEAAQIPQTPISDG